MPFVCDVIIGFLDTAAFWHSGVVRPSKALDTEQVRQLQIACDELFGLEPRLMDHFVADGLLRISSVTVSPNIYRIACLAHELFGMSSIDEAHRCPVYPAEDWDVPSIESLVDAGAVISWTRMRSRGAEGSGRSRPDELEKRVRARDPRACEVVRHEVALSRLTKRSREPRVRRSVDR